MEDKRIERCYYSNVARMLYRAPYSDILMLLRMTDRITKADLKEALARIRVKYPLLNARLIQDEAGKVETICDFTGDFPIYDFSAGAGVSALAIAGEKQKEAFDLENGPLIKFVMVNGDKTELAVVAHHYISDGLSLTYLLQDIAQAVKDHSLTFKKQALPLPIVKENLIAEAAAGKIGILMKLLIGTLNGIWRKTKVIYRQEDYERLYSTYWDKADLATSTVTVDKFTLERLIQRCKTAGVSVTAALAVAFSRALTVAYKQGKKPVKQALLAISARNLFKEPETDSFGFLAFGNQIALPKGRRDFWQQALSCSKEIKKMLMDPAKSLSLISLLDQIDPTLVDAMYFAEGGICKNLIAKLLYNIILANRNLMRRSLDITNLGVIKNDYPLIETIFFVPMLSSAYSRTLGIMTINGELNISMLCEKKEDRGQITVFQAEFLDYLKAAID